MKSTIRTMLVGAAILVSSLSFAGDLTGSWQGKFFVSETMYKNALKGKSPAEQKVVTDKLVKLTTPLIRLQLAPDKSFSFDGVDANTGDVKHYVGSWKSDGKTLVLDTKMINGKKIDMSKNQMELTYDPQAKQLMAPFNSNDFNLKLKRK